MIAKRNVAAKSVNTIASNLPIKSRTTKYVLSLPQYMLDEITRVNALIAASDANLKFGFVTDAHIYNAHYEKLYQVGQLEGLDFIVDGGDSIEGEHDKDEVLLYLSYISRIYTESGHDVIMCRGNHDTNFTDYATLVDQELIHNDEWYDRCCPHQVGEAVFDAVNPEGGYYYKDYDDAKIRVICMNTSDVIDDTGHALCHPVASDVRQTQFAWFCDHALNFMDKGSDKTNWGVIIVSHTSLFGTSYEIDYTNANEGTNNSNFAGVMTAFMEGGAYSATTNEGTDFQLISDVDFTEQGAMEYICGICGNAHWDVVSNTVMTLIGRPQIFVACMKCLQKGEGAGDGGTDLYPTTGDINTIVVPARPTGLSGDGTIDSELMDIFLINKATRTIQTIRYGAGADRTIAY